jgi:peptidoglycan/LPS O-acetylase OafA/YrhL
MRARSGSLPRWLGRAAEVFSLLALPVLAVIVATGHGHWGTWEGQGLPWGLFMLGVGFTSALAHVLSLDQSHRLRRFLRLAPLVTTGRLSYGLYLYHMVPIVIARRFDLHPGALSILGAPNWPYLLAYIAAQGVVAFLAAAWSYRLVEAPLLRLKERFS